jgi:hypothetical protein
VACRLSKRSFVRGDSVASRFVVSVGGVLLAAGMWVAVLVGGRRRRDARLGLGCIGVVGIREFRWRQA